MSWKALSDFDVTKQRLICKLKTAPKDIQELWTRRVQRMNWVENYDEFRQKIQWLGEQCQEQRPQDRASGHIRSTVHCERNCSVKQLVGDVQCHFPGKKNRIPQTRTVIEKACEVRTMWSAEEKAKRHELGTVSIIHYTAYIIKVCLHVFIFWLKEVFGGNTWKS